MAKSYGDRLRAEGMRLTTVINSIYDKAASENRDLTDDESTQVKGLEDDMARVNDNLDRYQASAEGAAKYMTLAGSSRQADEAAELRQAAAEDDAAKNTSASKVATTSFGSQVVDSDQFKNYGGRGAMEPVVIDGYLKSAAITTETLDLPAMRWAGPPEPALQSPLLSVIGRVATNGNSVEYVRWGDVEDAEVVAEGALKPERDMEPEKVTATLVTIAHWIAITRQALEDAPQIRSIVDTKLRAGVIRKLEADALTALTTATLPSATGTDLLRAIRQGIGTVQAEGYNPNALLLNPVDYAELDISVMEAGVGGPTRGQGFWGLTAVPANDVPAGSAYVGDFNTGVTWFDRGSTEVFVSDSHGDFFIRNMLAILAETRAAFTVPEPRALVEVSAGS